MVKVYITIKRGTTTWEWPVPESTVKLHEFVRLCKTAVEEAAVCQSFWFEVNRRSLKTERDKIKSGS